ncbi:hypothetical protein SANTM175S_01890 [Streptomyces antimycoticus]
MASNAARMHGRTAEAGLAAGFAQRRFVRRRPRFSWAAAVVHRRCWGISPPPRSSVRRPRRCRRPTDALLLRAWAEGASPPGRGRLRRHHDERMACGGRGPAARRSGRGARAAERQPLVHRPTGCLYRRVAPRRLAAAHDPARRPGRSGSRGQFQPAPGLAGRSATLRAGRGRRPCAGHAERPCDRPLQARRRRAGLPGACSHFRTPGRGTVMSRGSKRPPRRTPAARLVCSSSAWPRLVVEWKTTTSRTPAASIS